LERRQHRTGMRFATALILLSFPVCAQTVTDGDTIKMDGMTYRLWGIDAPENKQACADGWEAGKAAATYLYGLVRGHKVVCEAKDTDRYGRTVAICRADGRDLGADMVSAGIALAFVRYSSDYVEQENVAKAAGLGIHGRGCEAPWDWRARQRLPQ
jgi:endonuclease YncB( thermonuclease family)